MFTLIKDIAVPPSTQWPLEPTIRTVQSIMTMAMMMMMMMMIIIIMMVITLALVWTPLTDSIEQRFPSERQPSVWIMFRLFGGEQKDREGIAAPEGQRRYCSLCLAQMNSALSPTVVTE